MTESTPFLQSWIFDLILLFGGAMIGFIVAAMLAASGQASREEEMRLVDYTEIAEMKKKTESDNITEGKPDKE